MSKKLTEKLSKDSSRKILDLKYARFQILINSSLDKNYSFDNLKNNKGHKKFDDFIKNTVDKKLTISDVDRLYLRTKGRKESINVNGNIFQLMHYGKDRDAFRVFGYLLKVSSYDKS